MFLRGSECELVGNALDTRKKTRQRCNHSLIDFLYAVHQARQRGQKGQKRQKGRRRRRKGGGVSENFYPFWLPRGVAFDGKWLSQGYNAVVTNGKITSF